MKRIVMCFFAIILGMTVLFSAGCARDGASSSDQVVIYSNGDDEAVEAMKKALDGNCYSCQNLFQTFGTSELGGKLMAEGTDVEADLVTMSSFYLESAQAQSGMFTDLTFDTSALSEYPGYYSPVTALEGTIIYNTEMVKEKNLTVPAAIADLAKPEYKGLISMIDIQGSSTAWLMIQALVEQYGEEEAKTILKGIYDNAGDHIETSGSGPIKKVRAGEVAIGFGLRHQAVADKASGLPIDYADPMEGNYILTESVAVVNHGGGEKQDKAMAMAQCIIEKARPELLSIYPVPLYQGESVPAGGDGTPKVYSKPLTVELLKQHQALSESCK
ncbi:MAG: extracellular solute-binding protein [Eubacterium sp.]